MTGPRILTVTLAALLGLGVTAGPAPATGGGASPDVLTLPGSQQIVVRIGNPVVRAEGNGLSLAARATAMLRGRVAIAGRAPAGTAGAVRIERLDARGGWVTVADAPVASDGRFRALWRPSRTGPLTLRALALTAAAGTASGDPALAAGAPRLDLTVYRPGVASWYGPTTGTWGTACGVPLLRTTLGVAHRTLPCGTNVALYYRGRTVVVPVIDRGPFVAGRAWDLTRAAHEALGGDDGLITLGALPLLPAAQPARGR
jgi:rare lipoprotein A